MGKTTIEWTDQTWNPVTGCDKVSPGCDHCYAEGIAHRFAGTPQFPNGFGVTLRPERLGEPLRWRKPRRVFVNSMSDLFHADVPDEFIAKVFGVMAHAEQHTFQVLTKRPGRMRSLLRSDAFRELVFKSVDVGLPDVMGDAWPIPNVWLGVSAEDQKWADVRIPVLLDTPAAVRFVSAEPLLGPIDMQVWLEDDPEKYDVPALDWVIVGGESGRGARPMHPDWARSLRDQCVEASVPFLFKQWGEYVTPNQMTPEAFFGWDIEHGSGETRDAYWRLGKKAAGRELDEETWDEYPNVPLGEVAP